MAALTAGLEIKTRPHGPQDIREYRVADTELLYIGSYVCLQASSGDVIELTDAAGLQPLGRVVGFGDPLDGDGGDNTERITGATGATEPPRVGVDVGGRIELQVVVTGASAQSDVGKKVYKTDDGADFTLTATTFLDAVGEVAKWYSSTTCDVILYSAAKMAEL